MEKETMKVLYKAPLSNSKMVSVENTLEGLQRLVGGYIQTLPAVSLLGSDRKLTVICDKEAKLKYPEPKANLFINVPPVCDVICGSVAIVAAEGEWFDGLTEDEFTIAEAWIRMVEIVKVGDAAEKRGTYKITED